MEPDSNSNSTLINWTLYDDRSGRIHPHEPLERYNPGGFHPVALGDEFKDGRYVVRHKLGHGGFSTVWIASDEHQDSAHHYVAIKIKSSSSSEMGIDADPEVLRLGELEQYYLRGPQDKPRPYAQLLDHFSVEGPNGRHNCLVTELMGPSLRSVHSLYGQLEQVLRPETILRASRQLLQGIDFIHQAGLVHGDISAANVVFTCKSLLNDEHDDLLDLVSEVYVANPWPDKPLPSPHLPKQLVQTAKWSTWEDEMEEDIRLVDWGSAFPVGETVPVEAMAQPLDLRSPETFFLGKLDYRHDIWRAGCVIYVLYYQRNPFFVYLPDSYFYMLRIREKLGRLPESWLPKLAELRKESSYAERDDGREDPDANESEMICDTFEPRRQAIIAEFTSGDEKYDEHDEHTDSDFEALKSLQRLILALLRYETNDRVTAKYAMRMIEWVDHRREEEGSNYQDEDEYENGKGEKGDDMLEDNLNQLSLHEGQHK